MLRKTATKTYQYSLHKASKEGHYSLVKFILEELETVLCRDKEGKNPLHYAAMNGHTEIVKLLASFTEAPNAPDANGLTPLRKLILLKHFHLERFLLIHIFHRLGGYARTHVRHQGAGRFE